MQETFPIFVTLSLDNAKEMLDSLVMNDGLSYGLPSLRSKFNKQKFFDKNFYPISLFYLGMVTLKDRFNVVLPNLILRSIYMDYYNQLNNINGEDTRYVPAYEQYTHDRELEPLIRNYFEQYLGQFPAQVFDKMNENFVRCSFYELCSRYLSWAYTFALEQNNPADAAQVKEYAKVILAKFPYYNVRTYVVYIVANKGYRFWEV